MSIGAPMDSVVTGTVATKPTLLVLTSTYPRWADDPEPGFVHELARRLTDRFRVIVLGPHALGANAVELLDGVEVIRYRYAPKRLETLVNDGGIVNNLRQNKWKLLLVPGFVMAQLWRAWRLIQTSNIDVVHAHWLVPQGLIAAVLRRLPGRKVPFVVTSHGADLFALRAPLMQALKRFVVRHAAATTVVSESMREELARIGAANAKVSVQPMGVDLSSQFTPDPTVARSENQILFVGRLVEKKGLRHLINAMPGILAAHPNAFLTIAGFGPEQQASATQVEQLGLAQRVQFLGAVSQSDLPDLYRRAGLFVAPFVQAASGDREGLGLVSVEAAGCGCPVIVSDLPAVRDVFADGEATFVEPGNAKALGAAIISRLGSTEAGSAMVSSRLAAKFNWQEVADRYAVILDKKQKLPQ